MFANFHFYRHHHTSNGICNIHKFHREVLVWCPSPSTRRKITDERSLSTFCYSIGATVNLKL